MRTIDEVIQTFKQAEEEQRATAEHSVLINGKARHLEWAEYYKQMQDWLTELKILQEFKDWLLKEQYERRDSLFGLGIRYCAERLERKLK